MTTDAETNDEAFEREKQALIHEMLAHIRSTKLFRGDPYGLVLNILQAYFEDKFDEASDHVGHPLPDMPSLVFGVMTGLKLSRTQPEWFAEIAKIVLPDEEVAAWGAYFVPLVEVCSPALVRAATTTQEEGDLGAGA